MSDTTPESLTLPEPLRAILLEYDARTADFDEAELSFILERKQQECGELSEAQRKAIFAEIAALQLSLLDGQQKSRWGTRYCPALEGTRQDGTPVGNPDIGRVDQAIIQYWSERAREARHPILKARYADVIWDLSKIAAGAKPPIQMAWQAIDHYVECGERFPNAETADDRLERALELAISVRDNQRAIHAVEAMFALLDHAEEGESRGVWLFDSVYGRKGIDLTEEQQNRLIGRLEKELQQICGAPKPFGIDAKPLALRLARHYERLSRPEEIRRVICDYGDAVAKLAKEAQGLVAMHWLQDVYATYLQFGLKDEAERFQITAKEKGEDGEGQMVSSEFSLEITQEEIDNFLAAIMGEDLESTLTRVGVSFCPRVAQIRKQLEGMQASTPLYSMLSLSKLGENQVIAHAGSIESDPEGRVMFQMAANLKVSAAFLQLAIDRTREAFDFSAETILAFLLASPLFSADRRPLLERAITAYCDGDHIAAVHVMLPQIEQALRRLLGLLGKPTNKHRRSDLTVMVEKTLNDILENEQSIQDCLGEDVVMYLRVVLCDPRGLNVRNSVAHGLMEPGQFDRFISDRLLHIMLLLADIRESKSTTKEPADEQRDV